MHMVAQCACFTSETTLYWKPTESAPNFQEVTLKIKGDFLSLFIYFFPQVHAYRLPPSLHEKSICISNCMWPQAQLKPEGSKRLVI